MKRIFAILLALAVVASLGVATPAVAEQRVGNNAAVTSGKPDKPGKNQDQLVIVAEQNSGDFRVYDRSVADWGSAEAVVWSWNPRESADIDPAHYGWFNYPTDVKWADNGKLVILAAVGGGVAIVRYADQKVLFYANGSSGVHSAELLPDGNLVAVSSSRNRVRIFSTDRAVSPTPTNVVYRDYTLEDAHGALWDSQRDLLWVDGRYGSPQQPDGTGRLTSYRYNNQRQDPALTVANDYVLPASPDELPTWPGWWEAPHDVAPGVRPNTLLITTDLTILEFDIKTGATSEFVNLAEVKSVGWHQKTRELVMLVSKPAPWTSSDTVSFFSPKGSKGRGNASYSAQPDEQRLIPGTSMYKARWFGKTPGWSVTLPGTAFV